MCAFCSQEINPAPLARRGVLKLVAAAAGVTLAPRAEAANPLAPPKPGNVLSPDAALKRLMEGNARYVEGVSRRHDFQHEREALSAGQNPFAAVLSCADSRIAPEYCFDVGRGDIFVCRVAGNFASDDIIASFEYAVAVLNTPLIMVLGHDGCGAVDATIKSVTDDTTLPGHLPALVKAIRPAVEAVRGRHHGRHADMLAHAIRRNVAINVDKLKAAPPILKSAADDKKIRVVGGVYQLKTGKVTLLA
jgi:carbonic anhydrase